MRLTRHTALVTGGSRGIGKAIVERLAEEGAAVAFTGRDPQTGAALEKACVASGHAVKFLTADSAVEEDVRHAVATTIETFGGLTTLVNNAAATDMTGPGKPDSHVADIETFALEAVLRTGLLGTLWACKYSIRHMRDHGGGSIINISAASSILAIKGRPAYQASKGAINALTRQIPVDYGADNIRCNGIIVGFINTGGPAISKMVSNERFISGIRQQILVPRLGEPRDIANGVVYLASDESSYVTGALLPIDGGYSSHISIPDTSAAAAIEV
jgi:meso-butanediol dehydrogenase / (S,S)-butanediol dehydrogenase / diacetyl reductase